MTIWIVLGFLIVAILFIASITFYVHYYFKFHSCSSHPNYWCWNDWTCNTGNNDHNKIDDISRCPAAYVYGCAKDEPLKDANWCSSSTVDFNTPGCWCRIDNPHYNSDCECTLTVQNGFTAECSAVCTTSSVINNCQNY